MFYFKELKNRLKYLVVSYVIILLTSFYNYNILFTFLDFFFSQKLNKNFNTAFHYYIYTHPFELYYSQFYFCLTISFYFIIPYIVWQIYDFLIPSLYMSEYKFIKNTLSLFTYGGIILYCLIYTLLIPLFLYFILSLNNNYTSNFFSVFFELKVQDFINFILTLNLLVSAGLFLLLLLYLWLINQFSFKIVKQKKKFYAIFIVLATVLSPPDIFSQILIFILLNIFFEFMLFFKIFGLLFKYYGK
jgi:sec-independent protein translocase protein TatC